MRSATATDARASDAHDADAGVDAAGDVLDHSRPDASADGAADAFDGADRPEASVTGTRPDAGGVSPVALVVVPPRPAPANTSEMVVSVRGRPREAKRLQDSAEAVSVVELTRSRQRTADLGEVLAQTQGVGVRRQGGLGNSATVSLAGLEADQIRLFFDGVPLEMAGYPFGIVNMPVNLLERVEIYRGVVPIRFGADALGGAINLVPDTSLRTHAAASYQLGSFGTHRLAANGRYGDRARGLVLGGNAFFDVARNDFIMDDIRVPTPDGGTVVQSLRRFHDAYRSYGGNLEAGVIGKPWARKLFLNGFFSTYDKDLQHNAVMTLPYGAITYGETTYGSTVRYVVDPSPQVEVGLLANHAHRTIDFEDLSPFKYLWTGQTGMPVGRPPARGELSGRPVDQSIYENAFYGRVHVAWTPSLGHQFRLAVTPQFVTRIGDSHVPDRPDLLGLRESVITLVSGAEYQFDALEERLSNIVFVKDYAYQPSIETRSPLTTEIIERTDGRHRMGAGNAFRFRLRPWLMTKVSYEYATRLPRPDELFGNGVLVTPNAELRPEVSHNANLGPRVEARTKSFGEVTLDVNLFMRDTRDVIVLLGGAQFTPYQNIGNARGFGVDGMLGWFSPGRWLKVDATFTYQDIRNSSTSGTYASMNGQRIPSRPYMFASWGLAGRIPNLPSPRDTLEPYYVGRYTHGYKRGWDVGNPMYWITLPAMVSHDIGISWIAARNAARLVTTFAASNVTDAKLFDTFGVQRPGRAFSLKVGCEF